VSVAFLPTTPLLIPEIATGAAAELQTLRTAASHAVDEVCSGAAAVAVLVPGGTDMPLGSWSLRGLGVDVGEGEPVPVPVAIAAWLLGGRPAHILGTEVASSRLHAFDAVLAMGDGSAARTDKAPLHLDPQALLLDEAAVAALGAGDLDALRALDLTQTDAVGATGPRGWRTLAEAIEEVEHSELLATADPYGVQYLVATWRARWADPA
jgi:hypothetical protein